MKISDIIKTTFTTVYSTFGGREKVASANMFGAVATAPTKKDAEKAVVDNVSFCIRHAYDNKVFWSRDGKTALVLRAFPGGWGYEICGSDRSSSYTSFGKVTFAEACERVKAHADQY